MTMAKQWLAIIVVPFGNRGRNARHLCQTTNAPGLGHQVPATLARPALAASALRPDRRGGETGRRSAALSRRGGGSHSSLRGVSGVDCALRPGRRDQEHLVTL